MRERPRTFGNGRTSHQPRREPGMARHRQPLCERRNEDSSARAEADAESSANQFTQTHRIRPARFLAECRIDKGTAGWYNLLWLAGTGRPPMLLRRHGPLSM